MEVAFVLVRDAAVDGAAVVEAARELGIELAPAEGGDVLRFDVSTGGVLFVLSVAAAHPDAPHMPTGPFSPGPDAIAEAGAHLIVTAAGLPGDQEDRDRAHARLTAAVVRATGAIAAMLGHGVTFHRGEVFAGLVAATAEGELPVPVCVDVTVARESEDRMSFLTHGMVRYGREEFWLTAPIRGQGAFDFLLSMMGWMIRDRTKVLPTGDTLGRSADEKIEIQRVASPIGQGAEVIRLDLP